MSQELKTTKERVMRAAETCSTAKDTLKELFPEVFGRAKPFNYRDEVQGPNGLRGVVIREDRGVYDVAVPFMNRVEMHRWNHEDVKECA